MTMNDDEQLILLDKVSEKKLKATAKLAKILELPEDTIHIIVQRTAPGKETRLIDHSA